MELNRVRSQNGRGPGARSREQMESLLLQGLIREPQSGFIKQLEEPTKIKGKNTPNLVSEGHVV